VNFFQVQFVLVMIHAFQLLFIDCNYPRAFVWWIGLHAVMFYFLFSDFYKQAYNKKKAKEVRSGRTGVVGVCYLPLCISAPLFCCTNRSMCSLLSEWLQHFSEFQYAAAKTFKME
jgi:hypothetical protein